MDPASASRSTNAQSTDSASIEVRSRLRVSFKLKREALIKKTAKRIGLAIIGAGRVGLFRGEVAARHPQVDWIGLAERRPARANEVAQTIGADFVTGDFRALLARPEVTAVIVATDEHLHVDPILSAAERRLPMLIEKPLATELAASERVLRAIEAHRSDVRRVMSSARS